MKFFMRRIIEVKTGKEEGDGMRKEEKKARVTKGKRGGKKKMDIRVGKEDR